MKSAVKIVNVEYDAAEGAKVGVHERRTARDGAPWEMRCHRVAERRRLGSVSVVPVLDTYSGVLMTIYGLSLSGTVERRLKVEMGGTGLVFTFIDHARGTEVGRVLVQVDDILAAVTDPIVGGSVIEGLVPPHGPKSPLHVEVRRNEVLLKAGDPDVAVGLDDLQDAMEKVISKG